MFCSGVLSPETVLTPMSLLVHYKDLRQVVLQYNMEALADLLHGEDRDNRLVDRALERNWTDSV